jgi:hypothetical protein
LSFSIFTAVAVTQKAKNAAVKALEKKADPAKKAEKAKMKMTAKKAAKSLDEKTKGDGLAKFDKQKPRPEVSSLDHKIEGEKKSVDTIMSKLSVLKKAMSTSSLMKAKAPK